MPLLRDEASAVSRTTARERTHRHAILGAIHDFSVKVRHEVPRRRALYFARELYKDFERGIMSPYRSFLLGMARRMAATPR